MRLLFVLFIALAIVPLSAVLKCYEGRIKASISNVQPGKIERTCLSHSRRCIWRQTNITKDDVVVDTITERTCAISEATCNAKKPCSDDSGVPQAGLQTSWKTCCCTGDFCNGEMPQPRQKKTKKNHAAAPTALLAAAALVIAARI